MNINNKFDYVALDRNTATDGTRFYVDPTGDKLASVTTILSATSYNPGLDSWRAYVGEAKANQIRDEATGLGSLMHEHLENHMLNVERPKGSNLVRQMARKMADTVIAQGLTSVNEVWGIEAPLYYPAKYAGTADLIGLHNNKQSLMDFKTTNKMKTADMISDYFCQLVAYSEAHNILHGTDIQTGVIFMVSRDLQFKEFVVEGSEWQKKKDEWWRRVDSYYEMAAKGTLPDKK